MLKKTTIIFIFIFAGLAWSFSVSAATCPRDNGAGVGCNAGNNEYYCRSSCKTLYNPTPVPTLSYCQDKTTACAPGSDCANAASYPCGIPETCTSGYTLCNLTGTGNAPAYNDLANWMNVKCKLNTSVPANCSSYNQCTNACSICSAGYELLAGSCVGATVRLGTDSVLSDRLVNSTNALMSILSTGNVGIASTTPIARLGIASSTNNVINVGGGSIGGLDLTPINNDQAVPLGYLKSNYNASTTNFWGGSLTGNIWGLNTGNIGVGTTTPSNKFQVYGNGTYSASFLNGNVGIGITNPGNLLDTYGDTAIYTASNYNANAQLRLRTSDANGDFSGIRFTNNSATREAFFGVVQGNATNKGDFVFQGYNATAGAYREYLRIQNDGNVGIGTTNPGTTVPTGLGTPGNVLEIKSPNSVNGLYLRGSDGLRGLDITNEGSATGKVYFDSIYNNVAAGYGGFQFRVRTSGTPVDAVRIDSTGNVGIGTTNPGEKLEINGALKIGVGDGSADYIKFSRASYNYIQTPTSGTLAFVTNGLAMTDANSTLVLKSDRTAYFQGGNVGIGTTTPDSVLGFASSTVSKIDIHNGYVTGLTIVPINRADAVSLGYLNDNYNQSGVKGTGTINYITKWSDSKTIANSLLYDNGTNVGIGTTAPLAKLNIVETGPASDWDSLKVNFQANGTANGYNTTAGRFINTLAPSSQSYGIGVLGEAIKTQNYGYTATGAEGRGIYRSNSLGTNLNGLDLYGVSGKVSVEGTGANTINSGKSLYAYSNIDAGNILSTYWGVYVKAPTGAGTITNKYALVTEAAAGNVGIGTTSPVAKLHVVGGGAGATSLATAVSLAALKLDYTSNLGVGMYMGFIQSGGGAYQYIQPSNSNGTLAYHLVLNPYGGNVGIGTTTPDSVLGFASSTVSKIDIHNGYVTGLTIVPINRADAVSLGYLNDNYNQSGVKGTGTINYITKWSDSKTIANSLLYDNGTNVGIGTTTPGSKLNVVSSATDAHITLSNTNSASSSYVTYSLQNIAQQWQLGLHGDTSQFRIRNATAGTYPFVVNANGNVGIGTIAPRTKLELSSTVGSAPSWNIPPAFIINSTATAGLGVGPSLVFRGQSGSATSNFDFAAIQGAKDSAVGGENYGGSLIFSTQDIAGNDVIAERMRINSSGNIGVGTTNPLVKLQVQDNLSVNGNKDIVRLYGAISSNAYAGSLIFRSYYDDTANFNRAFAIQSKDKDNNVRSLLLNPDSGNVGIGTTTPSSALTVSGINDVINVSGRSIGGLDLTPTEASQAVPLGYLQSNYGASSDLSASKWTKGGDLMTAMQQFGTINNYPLPFITSSTERMRLTASGNLALGVNDATIRLHVETDAAKIAFFSSRINGGNYSGYIGNGQTSSLEEFGLYFAANDARLAVYDATNSLLMYGDSLYINNNTDNVGIGTSVPGAFKLKVAGDMAVTGTLSTQTGSDFAEEFRVNSPIAAGTVVVMGDLGYKSVKPCASSYDKTVVGIVSDNPSIVAGYIKLANKNEHKVIVAMSGVVSVKVTNLNGQISKGDLLTSSLVNGYAMKSLKSKPGTIIGKALEDLKGKEGMIKVLVNLQ